MRQRRLPIFILLLIGIFALVLFRLYCKIPPEQHKEDQPKHETQVAEKKRDRSKGGAVDAGSSTGQDKPAGQKNKRSAGKRERSESNADGPEKGDNGYKDAGDVNKRDNGYEDAGDLAFNRNLSKIIYTKHARCRMDCRQIDESEIIEMRDEGKVNYAKSELNSKRDPKFALEGITHDKQHVRVIFAQTSSSLVVVTCIDLDIDRACSCN